LATQTQIKNFINEIAPIIQKYAKAKGYKVASPIIAQACIESAYGTSSLGCKYHNYFGMKCGSGWKGKSVNLTTREEYTVGTLTTIKDNFRVYDSMEEGVKGYFDFISSKRYSNLKTATTYEEYLEYIKKDGYATSSKYVDTNMKVVTKYHLTNYDNFGNISLEITKINENVKYTIGETYTLQNTMYVRKEPYGTKLTQNELTVDAKKHAAKSADGYAALKKGTKVTCKEIANKNNAIWMKVPSGWICAIGISGKVYIK